MKSIEAEQAVLGSIMLDNSVFEKIKRILEPSDFYQVDHQQVYQAMIDLETGIDVITVNEKTSGAHTLLLTTCSSHPTSANAVHYAQIVKELSLKRKVKCTLDRVSSDICTDEADTSITKALSQLNDIKKDTIAVRGHHVNTMTSKVATHMMSPKEKESGVKTHLSALDNAIGCLRNSDLIVIGARPGMGKTAFALSMALNIALNGDPVLIISLEMSKERLVERLLCQLSGVSMQEIILQVNMDVNAPKIRDVAQRLHDAPIHIADNVYKYSKIEDVVRSAYESAQIKAVFIDYLQLMNLTKEMGDNRNQQLGYVTRNLKRLAKELSIPIVLLAQLNRSLEQRPDKRPKLSDLRDSGEIEQDIDIAMLLYRDSVYNKDTKYAGTVEVDIPKARNLSPAWLRLAFLAESMRFANLSDFREYDE